MPPHIPLNTGDRLYKYELQTWLGGGSFGDVWLAHDHTISRDVAVKVLASDVSIDERLKEARIGNHLDHPNLVKMHYADVIQYNGVDIVFIAMDYHAKGSILKEVNAGNFMSIPDVIRYMVDILRGLEYLHEQNFYHNDIKPQNILIGSSSQGVLTDYGISCYSPAGCPVPNRLFYLPHVAPEVLRTGNVSVQTDIYQAGITAFRLLNGFGKIHDRFNSLGQAGFNRLIQQGKVIQSGDFFPFIPQSLKRVVKKAVHVDPASRFQSALEMRRALERLGYPGYWTCDSTGRFVGHNASYEFRFEAQPKGAGLFDFTAFKKNKATGRETRVGEYSTKNVLRRQSDELKRNFMQRVVTG